MSSDGPRAADSAVMPDAELEKFYANLSHCLHAMGQRLTILRFAATAYSMPGITEENRLRHSKTTAEQVELVCGLYHCLREFLNTRQFAANCSSFELSEFLPVIENEKPALAASGVTIEVTMPDGPQSRLFADKERTSQALISVLGVAASVSSPGDVIELAFTLRNREVELVVQNKRTHGRNLAARDRLSLSLAEAYLKSQKGSFACVEDPFRASSTLPAPLEDALQSTVATSGAVSHHQAFAHQLQ